MSSIGDALSETRRQRGFSLKDAEKATRIRSRYLVALEHDDFSSIPGYTYARAFIKEYAAFLGIDPEPLVALFNERHQPAKMDQHSGQTPVMNTPYRRRSRAFTRPKYSNAKIAAAVVIAIVVVAGLFFMFRPSKVSNAGRSNAAQTISQTSGGKTPAARKSAAKAKRDTAPGTAAAPATGSTAAPGADNEVRIYLQVVGANGSWVRVTADGKQIFEDVLSPRSQQSWSAKNEVTLRAGDAGQLQVSVNGGEPRPLGESGAVIEETFGRGSE